MKNSKSKKMNTQEICNVADMAHKLRGLVGNSAEALEFAMDIFFKGASEVTTDNDGQILVNTGMKKHKSEFWAVG